MAHDLERHKTQGYIMGGFQKGDSFENDKYLDVEHNGNCHFGIKVNHPNNAPAVITHGDVSDIIKDAIAQFTSADQHIGASGEGKLIFFYFDPKAVTESSKPRSRRIIISKEFFHSLISTWYIADLNRCSELYGKLGLLLRPDNFLEDLCLLSAMVLAV